MFSCHLLIVLCLKASNETISVLPVILLLNLHASQRHLFGHSIVPVHN